MISFKEAEDYLDNILKLPKNWRYILETDKAGFLRLYLRHHARRIPFQNISLAAVEPKNRKIPTEVEVIKIGLDGYGGCCLNLNFFSKILFEALGMESFAIQGSHFGAPAEGTHCMVLVKLNEYEVYLVEAGGALPILDIVPMHSSFLPFRMLSAGGFPYEFRNMGDGLIGRYNISGGLFAGKYLDKDESLRTSWYVTPKKFTDFDTAMEATFVNTKLSGLLKNPLMSRYFYKGEAERIFPEIAESDHDNFVFVFKRRVVIGNAYSRLLVKDFDTYGDMKQILKECFPTLDHDEIERALNAFSQYEVMPSLYDKIL